MSHKENKGKIDDWVVVYDNKEKDVHFHIVGLINGVEKITSRIISINNNQVETANSFYSLGWPRKSLLNEIMDRFY